MPTFAKEPSLQEQMLNFLKRQFIGKLMQCEDFKIRVEDVTYFDGNYRINARGGNNFCITYYDVVDESTDLFLIRNNAIKTKACYWNGLDWVIAKNAAMYFEEAAASVWESLSQKGIPCVVVISEQSAVK